MHILRSSAKGDTTTSGVANSVIVDKKKEQNWSKDTSLRNTAGYGDGVG